jgi:cation/acetate symporter
MNYQTSPLAVAIFLAFVMAVLYISYYFARRGSSSSNYFAAGGEIHWAVNGVAFAGDYLSAASFLGICGMIAVAGYDGFLYSIGYLAGWIVALFVIAEPMKKLGKYTFTDALDSKFNSKGIQLAAGISTLMVSMFYLIPQMVGAGALITPLMGFPHQVGVIMVGTIVIIIVATAGMKSTTYVQFLKGGLLVLFSLVLVIFLLGRGFSTSPDQGGKVEYHNFAPIGISSQSGEQIVLDDPAYTVGKVWDLSKGDKTIQFVQLMKDGKETIWKVEGENLTETLFVTVLPNGSKLYNGKPKADEAFYAVGHMTDINGETNATIGSVDPFTFIKTIKESTVVLWSKDVVVDGDNTITIYSQKPTPGKEILSPGLKFKVDSERGATPFDKLDFISLMLALFLGTAALPHILIRYYTVPSPACARKSTIVAIVAIGFFYILTLYMGLGAMTNGVIDLTNDNMSAPLLAKSFGVILFACISAIAFATVLGTVSGLIVASSGAVAHDLMDNYLGIKMTDKGKVMAGKISALGVGVIAMILGILFQGMNVSYLVGWAFAVAASANLPAIVMILFWKKTTAKGVVASIIVGLTSALGLIMFSQQTYNEVYHLVNVVAPVPINNPAIISVPLSFAALVIVSLMTAKKVEETN